MDRKRKSKAGNKNPRGVYVRAVFLLCASACAIALAEVPGVEIFKGHREGRVENFAKTNLEMFKARPLESRFYSETWFNETQFPEQGIIAVSGFQIHNLGVSRGYCETYIVVSDPETGEHVSNDSYPPEKVKIDSEGFGLSCGEQRIELDGDRYRLHYRGKDITADFTYRILAPSFQQGDGTIRFLESGEFVKYNFPIPWAEVSGTLHYRGKTFSLKGAGSMNHDWQVLGPSRYMKEWRAFWMYAPAHTISMVICRSPELKGSWAKRLMVAEPGRILFSSHSFRFEEFEPTPVPGSDVPCPTRFRISALHGEDWLRGEVKLVNIQEKKEILQDMPWVVRKLARLFVEETWSYRFWMDFDFTFHFEGKDHRLKGRGAGDVVTGKPPKT